MWKRRRGEKKENKKEKFPVDGHGRLLISPPERRNCGRKDTKNTNKQTLIQNFFLKQPTQACRCSLRIHMLVESFGIGWGPALEEVGREHWGAVAARIVGIECAQLHLNFTVQKHWDIMCLFVHFLDLNDQFYVEGFNGTDFWSDFKSSMLHSCMLLHAFSFFLSLVTQRSCLLQII